MSFKRKYVEMTGQVEAKLKVLNQKEMKQSNKKKDVMSYERKRNPLCYGHDGDDWVGSGQSKSANQKEMKRSFKKKDVMSFERQRNPL